MIYFVSIQHLQEDSDDLWRAFCEHEFRGRHISETKYKTWRRFYQYLVDEREIKLKKITAGISSKARQAVPGLYSNTYIHSSLKLTWFCLQNVPFNRLILKCHVRSVVDKSVHRIIYLTILVEHALHHLLVRELILVVWSLQLNVSFISFCLTILK